MTSIFWQRVWQEFGLLLKAPHYEPEMWWIIIPLFVTFLVMTFYFGVYTREELGWNTALGNTIVLLFVSLDLLRHVYHYTIPASLHNFVNYPVSFIIIFIIILEALFLFRTAFTHAIPKKVMFFLASPLPVNLQAYVVIAIVYTRYVPSWYTLAAAVLLFVFLFAASKILQIVQSALIERGHKEEAIEVKLLKRESAALKRKAKTLKGKKAKEAREQAHEKHLAAHALEKELREEEQKEHGKLIEAKKLK